MKRRFSLRAAKPERRRWAIVGALPIMFVVLLWGSGTLWLNRGPLPQLLAATIDASLKAQLGPGYQVDTSLPRFVAPNQVYVDKIRVSATAAESSPVLLRGLKVIFHWRVLAGEVLGRVWDRARAAASPAEPAGPDLEEDDDKGLGAFDALPASISSLTIRELTLDVAEVPFLDVNGQKGTGAESPSGPGNEGEGEAKKGWTGLLFDSQTLARWLQSLLRWRQQTPANLSVQTLRLYREGEEFLHLMDVRLLPKEGGMDIVAKTDWRRARQPGWPVRALASWKISILKQEPQLPEQQDHKLLPRLEIEGELAGPGEISNDKWSVSLEQASVTAFWQGEELYVDRLLLADDEARVVLEGVLRPGAGGDWRNARLVLAVEADRVRLPEQLEFLASYGVAGTADLTGRLEGSWSRPVLAGKVTGKTGRLFDRPFRELTGEIRVDRESFVFHDAIVIGEAWAGSAHTRYLLDGKITYARPESGRPAILQLTVSTERGRVEEWLPAFVPALCELQGQVRGFLQVNGFMGDLGVSGELELVDGSFRNIPFDSLRGRFSWRPERLRLERAELRLGTVAVTASGNVGPAGLLALDVTGRGVPLELVYAVAVPSDRAGTDAGTDVWSRLAAGVRQWRQRDPDLSHPVAGNVSLNGRITGSLVRPALVATVSSTRLRIGSVEFSRSSGQLSWDGEDLTIPLFYLSRANGGIYSLQGVVRGLRQAPILDLQLEISGEPVPDLIEILGGPARDLRFVRLALAEGWFYGRAHLAGSLTKPQAVATFSLDEGKILGRPLQLRLDLRYADGRVRVERISR
ncbi:MAG: hypothetical protein IMX00_05575 [Limnochordales bacterium]|nr:hypothetical protein [Limnochordales bacterium]